MTSCEDCGRPFAKGAREYRWGGACGLELARTEHNDTNELELNCATATVTRLRAELAAATARADKTKLVVMLARRLLTLEEDQRSWSDGTWETCRAELDVALGLLPNPPKASERD